MLKKAYLFICISLVSVLIGNAPSVHAEDGEIVEAIIEYVNEEGKAIIEQYSSEINHEFLHIPVLSVKIEKTNLVLIKDHPSVASISENKIVELSNTEQITEVSLSKNQTETDYWNIDLIGAKNAWLEGYTGKGVKVAVIDTGIASHPEVSVAGGVATVDYTDSWTDDHGHGTHVAGVIAGKRNDHGIVGVAPDVQLFAVKALDQNGEGNLDDILQAIDWAIANGMDVINLSLGMKEEDPLLKDLISEAYESGILIVAASGNDGGSSSVLYPARYDQVIAVSAVDGRLNVTPFSSTGEYIEFAAPGFQITSTYLNHSYGVANGTSQAAPHVVGMLALLKEKYPQLSNKQIRRKLTEYVQDLGATGKDPLYGYGFITYFPSDKTPPKEVSDLIIENTSTESITVQWKNPTDEDLANIELFLNDEWVQAFTPEQESRYIIENVLPNETYELALYTIDHFGNRSNGLTEIIAIEDILEERLVDDQVLGITSEEAVVENVPPASPVVKEIKEASTSSKNKNINWTAQVIPPTPVEPNGTKEEKKNVPKRKSKTIEESAEEKEAEENEQKEENDEVEQEEKGFFGKIIDFIVSLIHSFFDWIRNLF